MASSSSITRVLSNDRTSPVSSSCNMNGVMFESNVRATRRVLRGPWKTTGCGPVVLALTAGPAVCAGVTSGGVDVLAEGLGTASTAGVGGPCLEPQDTRRVAMAAAGTTRRSLKVSLRPGN